MKTALEKTLFAVLFAAGEPMPLRRLADALELETEDLRRLLRNLSQELEDTDFPLRLLDLDGQYQLATRPRDSEAIRRVLLERRSAPLSQAALEVLAAVAYNQPVTRAYIEQVRGVDSTATVTSLTEKGLLEEAGRLEVPGRPITYRTTPAFLRTFGLSSLEDLPGAPAPEEADEDVLEGQIAFEGS